LQLRKQTLEQELRQAKLLILTLENDGRKRKHKSKDPIAIIPPAVLALTDDIAVLGQKFALTMQPWFKLKALNYCSSRPAIDLTSMDSWIRSREAFKSDDIELRYQAAQLFDVLATMPKVLKYFEKVDYVEAEACGLLCLNMLLYCTNIL
jgi:hypothetical protein